MAVSVAIPTFNSKAHLELAVRSAIDQTLDDIEIIIVDDGSTDGTVALSQSLAAVDPRIRFERLPCNGGPSVARNRALEMAQGRWFAVLDSDDVYGRDRLRRLVEIGETTGTDIVADNLIVFDSDDPSQAAFFLEPTRCSGWLTLESYLKRTIMYSREPNLGYLKPVMRLDSLRKAGLRYNPALRIAEDDDLIVRSLSGGMRYWLDSSATYAYRRHTASTSHRLSAIRAAEIAEAGWQVLSEQQSLPKGALKALRTRVESFERAAGFARLIEALKERRFSNSVYEAIRNPDILLLLRMPLGVALRRAFGLAAVSNLGEPDLRAAAAVAEILATHRISEVNRSGKMAGSV